MAKAMLLVPDDVEEDSSTRAPAGCLRRNRRNFSNAMESTIHNQGKLGGEWGEGGRSWNRKGEGRVM